jgi:5-methyltetrahydrofolate--homocysteine methyltransferase
MADLAALQAAIEAGDRGSAVRITREAVDEGLDPRTVLAAMTAAMEVIGARFQSQEIYVPEMLISARAMKEATAVLEPVLVQAGIRPEHTAVIGTIKGDLHDIGKNLVGMMWKGASIEVIDLGTNVSPERFVEAAREHGAHLVGISALLTTTMVGMKDVVAAVRAADLRGVKVIVGGAPVTQDFADMIGADGYAPDAASAVEAARAALRAG